MLALACGLRPLFFCRNANIIAGYFRMRQPLSPDLDS